MFKVNNKDTRTTPMASFSAFIVNFEHILQLCFSASVANFKQINTDWLPFKYTFTGLIF